MIGAGSILAESYETKGINKPYVWSSGLIEDNGLRINYESFRFCSVRGKLTLSRIDNIPPDREIALGDVGLLASELLSPRDYKRYSRNKPYKLGILPHYADADLPIIQNFAKKDGAIIIDATWPCEKVVKTIYQCESIISSSLHGLIVADSLGIPNQHVALSDRLKGGDYKFRDYYSVFDSERYFPITERDLSDLSVEALSNNVRDQYVRPADLPIIKDKIKKSFPANL